MSIVCLSCLCLLALPHTGWALPGLVQKQQQQQQQQLAWGHVQQSAGPQQRSEYASAAEAAAQASSVLHRSSGSIVQEPTASAGAAAAGAHPQLDRPAARRLLQTVACRDTNDRGEKVPWGLSSLQAEPASSLPARLRLPGPNAGAISVLLCIIAPGGVAASHPDLPKPSLSGCQPINPVNPGGCKVPWDRADSSKPWQTFAAGLAAASPRNGIGIRGLFPTIGEVYVVPTADEQGNLDTMRPPLPPRRIRAYTACEGRLRVLQAQQLGRTNWTMVMLPLLSSTTSVAATRADGLTVYLGEAEWMAKATAKGDVLVVAPAVPPPGRQTSIISRSFPAALPPVVPVLPMDCQPRLLQRYADSVAIGAVAAPGKEVVSLAAGGGTMTMDGSYPAATYAAAAAARLWFAYPNCPAATISTSLRQGRVVRSAAGGVAVPAVQLRAASAWLEQQPCSRVPVVRPRPDGLSLP
jgi:hypothetical protein